MKYTYEQKLIATLYVALTKEPWEEGPSDSEAIDLAHDWAWDNHPDAGPDTISASDLLRRIYDAAIKASRRGRK